METSLTGKALDFGSFLFGFESRVSNIFKQINYVNNQLNINASNRTFRAYVRFSVKAYKYVQFLQRIHYISSFSIVKKCNTNYLLIASFSTKLTRHQPSYHKVNIISTRSYKTYISYDALLLIHQRTAYSIFILLNRKGFQTHTEAIKHKIGGLLLGFIS